VLTSLTVIVLKDYYSSSVNNF